MSETVIPCPCGAHHPPENVPCVRYLSNELATLRAENAQLAQHLSRVTNCGSDGTEASHCGICVACQEMRAQLAAAIRALGDKP